MYFAPGRHVFGSGLFTKFLRSNLNKAPDLKFSILGQGRDLVCRGILCANYLPSSHRKEAVLSPKYEKSLIGYIPEPSRCRNILNRHLYARFM